MDAVLVVLELLDLRRKPVRLEKPPPLVVPPGKAPPPCDCGPGPGACRVGYNLEAKKKRLYPVFIYEVMNVTSSYKNIQIRCHKKQACSTVAIQMTSYLLSYPGYLGKQTA